MNLYEILQNPDHVGEGMTHFERLFAQKVGGGKINEIFGIPPLNYIGDGRPLTDYLISGNAVQDGTPSPDAPVDVAGCGVWDETRQSYKLPVTVNGTEYPIYLGTVPTTRRVKKLVLTGEENWSSVSSGLYRIVVNGYLRLSNIQIGMSSHFGGGYTVGAAPAAKRDELAFLVSDSGNNYMYLSPSQYLTTEEFKSYLAAQYASGTPVTVWYVLAEPETAVVNEPLMKIGDYADTVSAAQAGVTIPTVNGANVLDVPTEVKPSDVWIRGRIKEV